MYGGVGGGTREGSAYPIPERPSQNTTRCFLPLLGESHDIYVMKGGQKYCICILEKIL